MRARGVSLLDGSAFLAGTATNVFGFFLLADAWQGRAPRGSAGLAGLALIGIGGTLTILATKGIR
jgi:hypothetical protein